MTRRIFLLLVAFLVLTPSVVQAQIDPQQTTSPSTRSLPVKERLQQQKDMLQEKKSALQEKLSDQREAFKEKLSQLKDQRKQTIVENIDTKITAMNSRRTEQMTEALTRLSSLLDRIASKAALQKQQGKDTTLVDEKVATARTAIAAAQQAVATQEAKEYVIDITSEDALRSTVGQTIKLVREDLHSTFTSVQQARAAVVAAARELATLKGETVTPTASDSAN